MHNIHYHFFFFFNDTATTEIYTLSLHDALPIYAKSPFNIDFIQDKSAGVVPEAMRADILLSIKEGFRSGYRGSGFYPRDFSRDRKSTRLNSSHSQISYAVFCLKKKKAIDETSHH